MVTKYVNIIGLQQFESQELFCTHIDSKDFYFQMFSYSGTLVTYVFLDLNVYNKRHLLQYGVKGSIFIVFINQNKLTFCRGVPAYRGHMLVNQIVDPNYISYYFIYHISAQLDNFYLSEYHLLFFIGLLIYDPA